MADRVLKKAEALIEMKAEPESSSNSSNKILIEKNMTKYQRT